MTIRQAIALGSRFLACKGLRSPRMDTELILCSILDCNRSFLIAHTTDRLGGAQLKQFRAWLQKRGQHYPLQYLRGLQEFYGFDFVVSPAVLIPRPETEILVETALRFLSGKADRPAHILDVGTGSGCIAVSLARLMPSLKVTALDISMDTLRIASTNADRGGCRDRIDFVCSDLLGGILQGPRFDLVVSNPPYVAWEEFSVIDRSVRDFEPRVAVFSSAQGFGTTRLLLENAAVVMRPNARLLIELGRPVELFSTQAESTGWVVEELVPDLAGKTRCAVLCRDSSS